ncbi:conserved domain protein [Roseibium sp. TrichSKD4]|uniref:hypothetical protein n=1 Tax=Roseibium sp. TrichSKD4 TaxID=744980 RepID=UPI0001E56AFD|nr:hypothetical protein [Roseibium sp. TrichSKD4]EFO32587.1 conserved domain protein [Roseibium sp. TrichSKD4]
MNNFKFELNDEVKISISGETGIVTGRAEHLDARDQYHVRYKSADGRGIESWWSEDALEAA